MSATKKTGRNHVTLSLHNIVSNLPQSRPEGPVPNLRAQNLRAFPNDELPKDAAGDVFSQLLSTDETIRDNMVKLVREHAPQVVDLAASLNEQGQLQAIQVQQIQNSENFDVVFGANRTLAAAFLFADSKGKIPAEIEAEIVTQSNYKEAWMVSAVENLKRNELNPVERGRLYKKMENIYGIKAKDIATKFGIDKQLVYNDMNLLKLPEDKIRQVENKELGAARALEWMRKQKKDGRAAEPSKIPGKGGDSGNRRRMRTLVQMRALYEATGPIPRDGELPKAEWELCTEDVRKMIAYWIRPEHGNKIGTGPNAFRYETRKQMADRIAKEEEAVEAASVAAAQDEAAA